MPRRGHLDPCRCDAPVDIDTGQRTQNWPAVSDEPRALASGR